METGGLGLAVRQARKMALSHSSAAISDGQLLDCFIEQREEAAFAALVHRHGRMVLSTCRRILRNEHDAEDAFQAVFLVLVQKAGSIRRRECVANWLYGVAHKIALKALAANLNQKTKQYALREAPRLVVSPESALLDWRPILDQELARLPAVYREAVVLCDLESKTRREAARYLGIPEGTLSGRLTTARRLLARRLTTRGLMPNCGVLVTIGFECLVSSPAPSLINSTAQSAMRLLSGRDLAGSTTTVKAAALAKGMLTSLILGRIKLVIATLLVLSTLTAGVLTFGGYLNIVAARSEETHQSGKEAKLPGSATDSSDVRELLRKAKLATDAIGDAKIKEGGGDPIWWKTQLLLGIARAQYKANDKTAAAATLRDTIQLVLHLLESKDHHERKTRVLDEVADIHLDAGVFQAALQTAELIETPQGKAFVRANIAAARVPAGHHEELQNIARAYFAGTQQAFWTRSCTRGGIARHRDCSASLR